MNSFSLAKNGKGILLMICSSVLACFGQLLWKLAVDGNLLLLLMGFILYGIGAIVMIVAYKFGSLSVLQPILSVNYILSVLLGYFVLGEQLTMVNMAGVVAVFIGVVLIAGGE